MISLQYLHLIPACSVIKVLTLAVAGWDYNTSLETHWNMSYDFEV